MQPFITYVIILIAIFAVAVVVSNYSFISNYIERGPQLGMILEGSPLIQIKEGSPLIQIKEGSPLIIEKEGSPLMVIKEGSPLIQTKEGSPLIQTKEGSPLMIIKEGSPLMIIKEGSPLIQTKEGSPLIQIKSTTTTTTTTTTSTTTTTTTTTTTGTEQFCCCLISSGGCPTAPSANCFLLNVSCNQFGAAIQSCPGACGTTTTTTTSQPGCIRNKPDITVNPTSATLKLGETVNFTANVTNMDDTACGSTQFIFNTSQESFTLFNRSFNMFDITSDSSTFNLAPGQSRLVNFSYHTNFALPSNYTLNATASDSGDSSHSGFANFKINVLQSIVPLNFTCSPLSIGYQCMFDFNSNYLESINVLFLVSNSKSKIISSGGATSTLGDILIFNFYCSTYGTGTYKISWIAYKKSDTDLTTPIAYSTTSQDKTLTC